MVDWYVVAECQWLGPNFGQSEYLDMNGYTEGTMGNQNIEDDGEAGDPFLAYGIDTPDAIEGSFTFGQAQMEIGLLAGNRLVIKAGDITLPNFDPTGKTDYSIATKKYVDDAGGGGGEVNTASSQGTGTSIYYQKSGVDLQFNAIKSENNRLSIALDGTSHDVEFTVNEGNIDHNALANLNAGDNYEHISQDQKDNLHIIYSLEQHNNTHHSTNYHTESDGSGVATVHSDLTTIGSGNIITTGERNALHTIYSLEQHDNTYHSTNYEPAFSKNDAFNKDWGTIAGTVAQGNDSRFHTIYTLEVHDNTKHNPNYSAEGHTHDAETLQNDAISSNLAGGFNLSAANVINLKPSNDNDDYIAFLTSGEVPQMSFVGGNGKITNVVDPTNDQDVATKKYHNDNKTVAGDLDHDDIANPNANAEEQHLTDAQMGDLHTIYSLEQHNNSYHSTNYHTEVAGTGVATVHSDISSTGSQSIITTGERNALHPKQHAMDATAEHTRGDNAVLDASETYHGFLKKLDGTATNYMDGSGNWSVPAGGYTLEQHNNDYHDPDFCVDDDSRLSDARTPTAHVLATSGPHSGSLPLADIADYTAGRIIIGGSVDWQFLALGTENYVLKAGATYPAWGQVAWSELSGSQPAPISHNNTYHSTNYHTETDGTGVVTVHSDITSVGSGDIITTGERNALHTIYTLEVHDNAEHNPDYAAETRVFESSSTFPGSPSDGDLHWDDVDEAWYRRDSTAQAWIQIGASGAGGDVYPNVTLDMAFDYGKIINGANSKANAMKVGDPDDYIEVYADNHKVTLEVVGGGGLIIKYNGAGSAYPLKFIGSDTDDYFQMCTVDNIHYFSMIGGTEVHIQTTVGGAYIDLYADLKDQASAITTNTLDKIKAVESIPDGNVDYSTMPSEIEITNKDGKKFTDVGDMMYFNMSAIKELLEKVELLENRIKELEDK